MDVLFTYVCIIENSRTKKLSYSLEPWKLFYLLLRKKYLHGFK